MSDQNSNTETQIEDVLQEERILKLVDADVGLDLDTQVVVEVEFEDRTFAILTPATPEVILFKEISEGALEELDREAVLAMRKDIDYALGNFNLKISPQGEFFYLSGEPGEEAFSEAEVIEIPGDDEDEAEHLIVLVELDTGKDKFLLTTSMNPDMYIAEIADDAARLVKDEAELERLEKLLEPIIEQLDAGIAELEAEIEGEV
ncbi:MAG: hypothetical protein ACE366_05320 [Bradymonadia bacterium]